MVENLCMLAVIMALVLGCSFLASLIPGRPVPEVVFFVFAGAIVGPNCLGLVQPLDGLALISRLAWGFSSSWRATSLTRASLPEGWAGTQP